MDVIKLISNNFDWQLKGNNFAIQSLFTGPEEHICICEKLFQAVCGSRGSYIKPDWVRQQI